MNKKIKAICLFFLILFLACCEDSNKKTYTIGFSQCMLDDVWRQAMKIEMNIEVSNYDNIEIIVKDAEEDNQKQIQQIRELINKKVDVLIISPNEPNSITPIAVEAYRKGIPTIIADRKINSDEYTSYVGGDSYQIGKMAGEHASGLLPDPATILEVWGTTTTSPAIERHQGFIDGLDKSKKISIIPINGKWRREIAKQETKKLKHYSDIGLIYAHNDVMAIGAREAIAELDSTQLERLKILGADGSFGKDAGLEAVVDGRLDGSFLYPTGGDQIIKVAMKILKGQPVEKKYILNTAKIDKSTAQTLLLQSDQLVSYQNRIEQQRKNLDAILNKFSILRHSLIVIVSLMLVLLLFSIYVYYINRKINKRNIELRSKNKEIEEQKQQLLVLNEKIKEVNEQKIRLFMNVSHEIRTPLTLIASPLDKWLKNAQTPPPLTDMIRMTKNVDRLTRIINQLLDFQGIENNESQLTVGQKDIVSFAESVKSLFDELAESKQIRYVFTSDKPSALLWFDSDKMEKILANLLSNAFKFTPENGEIALAIHSTEEKVSIVVEDNGCGIKQEKLPYIFDRFYTDGSEENTGNGIGLHLTQEFVKMHGATIRVESVPSQRTAFIVDIPTGKDHLPEFSIFEAENNPLASGKMLIDTEITKELIDKKYPYTVLIVEDDVEIREYLSEELSENFHILTAGNGLEAIRVLNEPGNHVTLVISDILMPSMNGFELCKKIKTSPELSDIPVILLTALGDIDHRMYGIAEGADDYIQKPFNTDYVKIKIIRLLEERQRLQKRFMRIMQARGIPMIAGEEQMDDSDKIFISKFVSLLESSYAKDDMSVEKLSREMNVSRVQLYRKIKEITGFTPVDYLRNYRLTKAVELLQKRRFSISEVAFQTGFSSPAYFTKCFRDAFNMTPTEYLDKN